MMTGRSVGVAIMPTDFLGCLCVASQPECCCRDSLPGQLKLRAGAQACWVRRWRI